LSENVAKLKENKKVGFGDVMLVKKWSAVKLINTAWFDQSLSVKLNIPTTTDYMSMPAISHKLTK